MTGAELKTKFNLAINAVAPGFLDSEISEFLTQAQLVLVKNLLSSAEASYLLHPLVSSEQLQAVSEYGTKYVDSIVYRATIPNTVLKILIDSVSTSVLNSHTNNKLLFRCDVLSMESIGRYIKTSTNNPYLIRPVVFIGRSSDYTYKDVLILFTNELLSSLPNYDTVTLYIDYIRYPNKIDVTDNVTKIELPEYADDIVNIATKAALASLYMVQGVANGQQAQAPQDGGTEG